MDADGCLPVSLIASFNRLQALTQDLNLIVDSVKDSHIVEVKDRIKVRSRMKVCHRIPPFIEFLKTLFHVNVQYEKGKIFCQRILVSSSSSIIRP